MHVHIHAEELRSTFVSHSGRKAIIINSDIDPDSPESAWDLVIDAFARALCGHVDGSAALLSDFSTTGVLEKLVSQVCLLDVFESYFEYLLLCGCGFPEITLTGTIDDWMRLRQKIELLEPFKVDFWLPHLREIADHFCLAMRGQADIRYWQDMYKQTEEYGFDLVNGWILKLIPYLQNEATGTWDFLNPLLEVPEKTPARLRGAKTDQLPAGMSVVPLTCVDKRTGMARQMEMIGGFVGIEQNPDTSAVQPKIGWAIRKAKDTGWQFLHDSKLIQKRSAIPMSNFSSVVWMLQKQTRFCANLPGEFLEFYKQCDGLVVQDRDGTVWNIHPFAQVQRGEVEPIDQFDGVSDYDTPIIVNPDRTWQIADASDGSIVLLSTSMQRGRLFEVRVINSKGISNVSYLGLRNFISHLVENAVDISES